MDCFQEQKNSASEQAQQNGIGRTTQWRIDKIRKLDPGLAEQCEAGTMKVAEAERVELTM